MRQARIDGKAVHVPNASLLAYGTSRARVGHWVVFSIAADEPACNVGRVLGRIVYSAGWTNVDGTVVPAVEHWLAVLTLSRHLSSAHIQWVNPYLVAACTPNPPDMARFLAWFATAQFKRDGGSYAQLAYATERGAVCANFRASFDAREGARVCK